MNIKLNEQQTELFNEIKTYYGFTNKGSVLGMLLVKEANRIYGLGKTRILIPDKDYQILEMEAQKHGLTADEYADQIVREQLNKAGFDILEGLKHGETV